MVALDNVSLWKEDPWLLHGVGGCFGKQNGLHVNNVGEDGDSETLHGNDPRGCRCG